MDLERVAAPRAEHAQRATPTATPAGSTSTSCPTARRSRATASRVGDVQDVIEAAVGGQPIEVTVEGRNRFTINVRYPRDLRQDLERLRHVLVPLPRGGGASSGRRRAAPRGRDGRGARAPPRQPGSCWPAMSTSASVAARAWAGRQAARRCAPRRRSASPMRRAACGAASARGDRRRRRCPAGRRQGRAARRRPGAESRRVGAGTAAHVPLGQVADIRIVTGPPMIRDEAGMLVGYVYVDMDAASATSAATSTRPSGS